MKTIFITGASTGLGKATAQLFAAEGWSVIATMRHPERETELSGIPNVTLMPLDVTDPQQIIHTAEKAIALGDIDVVLNYAGYGLAGPPEGITVAGPLEGITIDQIVRQIETNLPGVIRTTKAFIPHFRAKQSGLFITITSIGGLVAVPINSIYHACKWALEGWSQSMAFKLKRFGVGIKTVAPGGMKTDFFSRSFDTARQEAYDGMVDKVMNVVRDPKRMSTYPTPGQIVRVVYEAATDGKDQLRYVAGEDAKQTYAMRLQLGDEEFHKARDQQFFG